MDGWSGRIDSADDPEALRWHQVVRASADYASAGVAFLGFTCDVGVRRNGGRPGAALGPAALRRALSNLPVVGGVPLHDAGDVGCADGDLEDAQRIFADQAAALLDQGHLVVGLGGGHEIGFASYLSLARHAPTSRIAIVNLDAHFDLREGPISTSGTPYLQAIVHAANHRIALNYHCLGVSASSNTQRLFRTAQSTGSRYMLDDELKPWQIDESIERLMTWLEASDVVYLSVCLDVLPSAVAPGVSAPNPRGVPLDVVEPLVEALAESGKLRLLDVAELSPPFDRDNTTARVAARLIHRIVASHSSRRPPLEHSPNRRLYSREVCSRVTQARSALGDFEG